MQIEVVVVTTMAAKPRYILSRNEKDEALSETLVKTAVDYSPSDRIHEKRWTVTQKLSADSGRLPHQYGPVERNIIPESSKGPSHFFFSLAT